MGNTITSPLRQKEHVMLKLKEIGIDNWSRPVYKDNKGRLWKDINLGRGTPNLNRALNDDFYGEPDYPIKGDYEIVDEKEVPPSNNPCDTCDNAGWETMAKVAACNCCENHEFYSPIRKTYY